MRRPEDEVLLQLSSPGLLQKSDMAIDDGKEVIIFRLIHELLDLIVPGPLILVVAGDPKPAHITGAGPISIAINKCMRLKRSSCWSAISWRRCRHWMFPFFSWISRFKRRRGQPLRLFAGTIFDRKTFFFLKTRPIYEIAMNLTFFLLKSVEKFDIMIYVENLVFANKNSK